MNNKYLMAKIALLANSMAGPKAPEQIGLSFEDQEINRANRKAERKAWKEYKKQQKIEKARRKREKQQKGD